MLFVGVTEFTYLSNLLIYIAGCIRMLRLLQINIIRLIVTLYVLNFPLIFLSPQNLQYSFSLLE